MNFSIQFELPDDLDGTAECECDLCDRVYEAYEAEPISNPLRRLAAGDTIPVGECPDCDSGFLYLVEDED